MQLSDRGTILGSVFYYIRWYHVMNIRFLKSQCAKVFMFFSKTLFLVFYPQEDSYKHGVVWVFKVLHLLQTDLGH